MIDSMKKMEYGSSMGRDHRTISCRLPDSSPGTRLPAMPLLMVGFLYPSR